MGEFKSGDAAVESALSQAVAQETALPESGWWQEQAAAFRRGERECAPRSVTVEANTALEGWGEELGFFRRLLRRVLRKCMRWYVEPIVQQQNAVNRALERALEEQRARLEALEAQRRE